ncbi:MAG: NUDIX hydrolase [Candidatus Riflebacteria bacterium]|nr:NUDIX hydrolase [Candidatus Riflebacteria bacterium]
MTPESSPETPAWVPRGPSLTVDAIIRMPSGAVVLIKRKYPPLGWAIPGGFVDYGESVEDAVVREAREETGLEIRQVRQFHTYSDPARDSRRHTVSVCFVAAAEGTPVASDDAAEIGVFTREGLPRPLCFDHERILEDYFEGRY